MIGTLTIKPTCAKLTYDTEIFGQMDPYVKVRVGNQEYKTKTANDMGKNPTWNDTFTFKINGEQTLDFYLYDKDVGKDDYIGEGKINLSTLYQRRQISDWFPVQRKKKKRSR